MSRARQFDTCPVSNADDAFEVAFAGDARRIAPALLDVLEIQPTAVDRRHGTQQPALALEQRQARQIVAIDTEDIEGLEVEPVLRKKSRYGGLKTILVMETAEKRSGGDTMPVRKPMTG
jgi:hypothetical protein